MLREKDLIITPGKPPLKRRPDLVVREGDRVIKILEIQRSVLSKDDFIERTQHLQSLCSDVQWIFFKGTYARMSSQRRWLSDIGLPYYYLFLEGYKLVVEVGQPPAFREHKVAKKSVKSDCRFDDPNKSSQPSQESLSEPSLPLSVVGAAVFHEKNLGTLRKPPQFPRWNCSVGDDIEVWINGRWLQGFVFSYTQSDIPVVQLRKNTGKGHRFFSPSSPELIRLSQPSQQEKSLQDSHQQLDQLDLFFLN
ncbi:MAG: hypothetical protein JO235_13980 [Chroococcidiopsidaceae cyanobacterium CP_BM_RX_35]|nr:hypothetical protein [Chroococcidiopsidaceae cyanobacterium CP_BM_RX_35]